LAAGADECAAVIEVEMVMMECLFASMLQHSQELGYAEFDLGLSALVGVGELRNPGG
jgi:lysylphosphatidylglycerol synthetase-like protein (DUF2156 family)